MRYKAKKNPKTNPKRISAIFTFKANQIIRSRDKTKFLGLGTEYWTIGL